MITVKNLPHLNSQDKLFNYMNIHYTNKSEGF